MTDTFESQSFILRVWVEESLEETRQPTWRGQITNVTTGERRFIKSLDEINSFLIPYLKNMGVNIQDNS